MGGRQIRGLKGTNAKCGFRPIPPPLADPTDEGCGLG